MKNWIKIEENLPEEGTTVLFYNEKWIDDETCPEGIVIGFRTDDHFNCAFWNNYQDNWDNMKATPTHWKSVL